MTDEIGASAKSVSAWGQAVAAVALVGTLGVGLWALGEASTSGTGERPPATCFDGESEEPDGGTGAARRVLSGTQLCEALHRPDLADLLGTPGERAKSAVGSDSTVGSGSNALAIPSAEVEFETYTVTLGATYDGRPVAGSTAYPGNDAQRVTALGRPAVLYSDRTISISFRLDGSDASSGGPGLPVRTLSVAQDAKDGGGSFEVSLWRTDGRVPDDAVLLRVAEKVLPTVPGWAGRR
ncbi:DUF6215 domain-containing protein [Streptomyces sp. NPDC019507]|uniref:DUF6215 domain-containing protein n=1 Tax=Streptomyces sp. NPDC019507 TaxID=3154689 RepID=UPI0033C208E2